MSNPELNPKPAQKRPRPEPEPMTSADHRRSIPGRPSNAPGATHGELSARRLRNLKGR